MKYLSSEQLNKMDGVKCCSEFIYKIKCIKIIQLFNNGFSPYFLFDDNRVDVDSFILPFFLRFIEKHFNKYFLCLRWANYNENIQMINLSYVESLKFFRDSDNNIHEFCFNMKHNLRIMIDDSSNLFVNNRRCKTLNKASLISLKIYKNFLKGKYRGYPSIELKVKTNLFTDDEESSVEENPESEGIISKIRNFIKN